MSMGGRAGVILMALVGGGGRGVGNGGGMLR